VLLNVFFGSLAALSWLLALWQWIAARRFPLHRRGAGAPVVPGVSVLKPLKGCDALTEACLESWFGQEYPGDIQLLFGVASAEDPVCEVVRKLIRKFPGCHAELKICTPLCGTNAKIAKLAQLEDLAAHEILIISDADVKVSPDLVSNLVFQLQDQRIGLVNCLYRLADAPTLAMRLEAMATNADFWSQVLQSRDLKPMDFALGAVMATRRTQLNGIGGFAALVDCLADDYQLGHRIADLGYRIELSTVVAECRSAPVSARHVWHHQLRWARTIRVCEPIPYFLSMLSNPTFWPLLWLACAPGRYSAGLVVAALGCRCWFAWDLQRRLAGRPISIGWGLLAPVKDLLQTALWITAHMGRRVVWRGERLVLQRDGTLVRA